jgi:hypothetical protein
LEYTLVWKGAAIRLGNDGLCAGSCGNLAACFGRLGAQRDQLNWARRALAYQSPRFEGYPELQAAYWAARGHASLDDRSAALDTMARVDARMPQGAPDSIRSVWALMKADVLWALGNERSARTTALEGVTAEPTPHFEGTYARWLAATATTREDLMRARLRVDSLKSRLAQFDAVDQAEILIATQMIAQALGLSSDSDNGELAGAFQKLPPRVGSELTRFAAMATSYGACILAALSTAAQLA